MRKKTLARQPLQHADGFCSDTSAEANLSGLRYFKKHPFVVYFFLYSQRHSVVYKSFLPPHPLIWWLETGWQLFAWTSISAVLCRAQKCS